jgi:hypothetical protein
VLLVSACADGGPVSPPAEDVKSSLTTATTNACQTITFDQFSHGNIVTSVALSGMTINFGVSSFRLPNGNTNPNNRLRAFNTNVDPTKGDGVYGPGDWEDLDLLWRTPGVCEDCEGLGRILVIEDERGFNPWGDYRRGGIITLTGFAPNSFIDRITVVDNNVGEPPMVLRVNGTQVAASTPHGEGEVEILSPSSKPVITGNVEIQMGTVAVDQVTGSGGIDNIKICTREELGEEGCTPGFWKNHPARWAATGLSRSQTLESVFDVPDAFGVDNSTLLAALSFSGGPALADAARLLLHHAVAALLNASHPGVDYPRAAGTIITQVNAALASNSRSTMLALKNALDRDNNLGCPLN